MILGDHPLQKVINYFALVSFISLAGLSVYMFITIKANKALSIEHDKVLASSKKQEQVVKELKIKLLAQEKEYLPRIAEADKEATKILIAGKAPTFDEYTKQVEANKLMKKLYESAKDESEAQEMLYTKIKKLHDIQIKQLKNEKAMGITLGVGIGIGIGVLVTVLVVK